MPLFRFPNSTNYPLSIFKVKPSTNSKLFLEQASLETSQSGLLNSYLSVTSSYNKETAQDRCTSVVKMNQSNQTYGSKTLIMNANSDSLC